VEFLSVGGVSCLIWKGKDVSVPEIIESPAIPIGARICGSQMCQEAQDYRKTWRIYGWRAKGKPRAVENRLIKRLLTANGLVFNKPRYQAHQSEKTWRKRANQGFTSRGFGCGDMIDSVSVPPDRWRLKMRGSWERLEMGEKMGLRGETMHKL
jgi:hypothetical protein